MGPQSSAPWPLVGRVEGSNARFHQLPKEIRGGGRAGSSRESLASRAPAVTQAWGAWVSCSWGQTALNLLWEKRTGNGKASSLIRTLSGAITRSL